MKPIMILWMLTLSVNGCDDTAYEAERLDAPAGWQLSFVDSDNAAQMNAAFALSGAFDTVETVVLESNGLAVAMGTDGGLVGYQRVRCSERGMVVSNTGTPQGPYAHGQSNYRAGDGFVPTAIAQRLRPSQTFVLTAELVNSTTTTVACTVTSVESPRHFDTSGGG